MPDLSSSQTRRELIERAYDTAINALAPGHAVRRVLARTDGGFRVDGDDLPVAGRLIVVAVGKAAAPMAGAVHDILGGIVDKGFVLTKDGHAPTAPDSFDVFEAAHPVPDSRGIEASKAILDAVDHLGPDDLVLALISGGGSALFERPVDGITLADMQDVTDLLLRAGAPIQALNAVRSELSDVKGGGFRRHIGDAATVSLILSDVLGNSPEIIASGPTVIRQPNPARALDVVATYGVLEQMPHAAREHLTKMERSDRPGRTPDNGRDLYRIIGDNNSLVNAVANHLHDQGLTVDWMWREKEGEARERGSEWVGFLERSNADVIVGGGEMTVAVRGDGVGGRNTEFALAAAMALHERGTALDMTVASLASDGQDGGVDAAGAVVDSDTVDALRTAGIDPNDALSNNDSGTALKEIGALISSGPTGTNVNDVYIGIRH